MIVDLDEESPPRPRIRLLAVVACTAVAFAVGGIAGDALSTPGARVLAPIGRIAPNEQGVAMLRELNRRIATCDGGTTDVLDQVDYCLGTGPWRSHGQTHREF